jgi:septum formation protein
MRRAGYAFEVLRPPLIEPERFGASLPPLACAEANSYFKASSVLDLLNQPAVIVGADTIVVSRGEVYGKPRDESDARRILSALAGTTHEVITGVTVLSSETEERLIAHETSVVSMRALPGDFLEGYLAGGAWRGKAGAYGIQDEGDPLVDRIAGEFENVVGLPMKRLAEMLSFWGFST